MFINLLLLTLLSLTLISCVPATPVSTEQLMEPSVETQAPATQHLPTEEPVQAEISPTELPPTEVLEIACTKLLTPQDNVELSAAGKVTFAWEPVADADLYLLNFNLPAGDNVEFKTDETAKDRYMEAFGMSGEFEWSVVTLDVKGNEIYTSFPFSFIKPETPKNGNSGKGGNNDNQCPPWGCSTTD